MHQCPICLSDKVEIVGHLFSNWGDERIYEVAKCRSCGHTDSESEFVEIERWLTFKELLGFFTVVVSLLLFAWIVGKVG